MSTVVATSQTAPGPVGPAPHVSHAVHFYDEPDFPARSVGDFLWAALEGGGGAVFLTTPEHARLIEERLAERGAALPALVASGRLVVADARASVEAFMAGDLPDRARFHAIIGDLLDAASRAAPRGKIHAFGECVAILADDGKVEAALAVEGLWNEVLSPRPCALYCAYPLRLFAVEALAEPFLRVCDLHGDVIPVSSLPGDGGRHGRCVAVLEQQARALSHLAEERGEALRRLAEADRRKDEFLAMLGHELRNPLAPIVTALELLDQRADPCCRRERGIIRRQTGHLRRLVDDLIDVSRITHGKIELRPETMELAVAVSQAVELTAPIFARRAHQLTISVPAHGFVVRADPVRLCQILSNLLTNAATYTPPGGHVTISARREGGDVALDVTDDGEGLRPDMLSAIFDLFVQGARPLDRPQGGLGLGLPLSRRLAEMHGGTLTATSAGPGQGSTFTLQLPAQPVTSSRGHRVLVVDDNQDAGDMLAELIQEAGYEVSVAYDGPAALASATRSPPDVAVLDIGLPGMDGYALAAKLREGQGESRLRLIATTGYGQEADVERSRAAGFDVHLVKPVEPQALLRALLG